MGRFSKKRKKIAKRFPFLVTSGHNSAIIPDRQKLTAKQAIYVLSSFYFYR